MSYYGYRTYVSAEEKKRKAQKALGKLKKLVSNKKAI